MKETIKEYMNNTTDFDAVVEEKIMRQGFDLLERRAAWSGIIATTFEDIAREDAQKEVVPKTSTRRLWQYAAAIGLALVATLAVWYFYASSTTKRVPKPYIQKGNQGDKSQLVADATVDIDKLLNNSIEGFQATIVRKDLKGAENWEADFQSGKFTEVIQALESVGKKRTAGQSYFLAQAYLKMNPKNTKKAQPLFKLVSTANSEYAQDALWSYALICVLHQENETAKVALSAIIGNSPIHVEEAQRLMEIINKK